MAGAEVWVLKPIRYFSILRNEVSTRASERSARGLEANGGGFYASGDRSQRHAGPARGGLPGAGPDGPAPGSGGRSRQVQGPVSAAGAPSSVLLDAISRMPASSSAFFAEPEGSERAIDLTDDLGNMLMDLDYETDGSGRGVPKFFRARAGARSAESAGVVAVEG